MKSTAEKIRLKATNGNIAISFSREYPDAAKHIPATVQSFLSGASCNVSQIPSAALTKIQTGEAGPSDILNGHGVHIIPNPTVADKQSAAKWIEIPTYNPAMP